jgi:non-ribosomal peptide synthetase component E (peptide arylation enzyme)
VAELFGLPPVIKLPSDHDFSRGYPIINFIYDIETEYDNNVIRMIKNSMASPQPKFSISSCWDENARRYPRKEAIGDGSQTLSWAEAKTWIDQAAVGLVRLGIAKNEVVVIQLPNCVELHLLRAACEKAGIICVPILTTMREHEIRRILNYTNAVAVIVPQEFRKIKYLEIIRNIQPQLRSLKHVIGLGDNPGEFESSIRQLTNRSVEELDLDRLEKRRFQPDEISVAFSTSGSSGFPKFAEYKAMSADAGVELANLLSINAEDIVAAIAPAARGPNLCVYYSAPIVAAKIIMVPWFGPAEALRMIAKEQVSVACLVPTQLTMMLHEVEIHHYDLSSVRIWLSAGSPLPASIAREVEEKLGGITLNQYGAVDFGAVSVPMPSDSFSVRVSTVGKPRFGNEITILDDNGNEVSGNEVGEIVGRGPFCSSGYYKDPQSTREAWGENGWFRTGDLGNFDRFGNLTIIGRKKDIIIRGGQNIIPSEIENMLRTHPKIQNVAIVPMPDLVMGEKVCAYLTVKDGSPVTFEEISTFLRKKNIAPFKMPERLEIIDQFPTLADGQKIDKQALAEDIARKIDKAIKK